MTEKNCNALIKDKQVKSKTRVTSTKDFIARAKEIYGNRYTFDKSEYKTTKDKIIISCTIHGDFQKVVHNFLQGQGCQSCTRGYRSRFTTAQFIERAKNIHGSKFDYSKAIYTHSQCRILITCKKHGDFEQTPDRHLRSRHGCPECAKTKTAKANTKNITHFIREAKRKHGNKYEYSKSIYVSSTELITITCPRHGDFKRTVASHLVGYGCNICAGVRGRVKTVDGFIERAKEVHGEDRYDYSHSTYISTHEKIKILCPNHGFFEQVAASHLQGNGCSDCASELVGGYSRSDFMRKCSKNNNGNATLYTIKCYNNRESFYKIGITSNDLQTRFQNRRAMPYNFEEFYLIEAEAGYIYDLEVRLHSLLKPWSYKPSVIFRGYTECFSIIKPIDELLRQLSSDNQIQLIA